MGNAGGMSMISVVEGSVGGSVVVGGWVDGSVDAVGAVSLPGSVL